MTSQKKLIACYVAFAICVITTCIPQMDVQSFALIFSTVMIIAFYIVRRQWDAKSFEYKEASFLIKTFWIWSAIYVVGMLVAGALISSFGDMTVINEWTESVVQLGITPTEEDMKRVTQEYMDANFEIMVKATILSVLPAQIYAIWRSKSGLTRILNPVAPKPDDIISP